MHPTADRHMCRSGSPACGRPLHRGAGFLAGDAERAAAAAGRDDVRVLDLEAGAGERVDVVDLRAVDVLERVRLDEQLETVTLEDAVVRALLVEGEVVLEARAAAAADAHPKPRDGHVGALRIEVLARLRGALV